jgi:hypothetical protein
MRYQWFIKNILDIFREVFEEKMLKNANFKYKHVIAICKIQKIINAPSLLDTEAATTLD